MAPRTYYGIGLLAVLSVIVTGYVYLTFLKIDSPLNIEGTDGRNALTRRIEPLPGIRQRHLSVQQSASLRIQLGRFASQNFWIVAETGIYAPESEQMKFGQQLRNALLSAGWIESRFIRQRMGTHGFKQTEMAPISHGGDSGVVIFADHASIGAGERLNLALNALRIRSSVEPDDTMKNAILIFIGDQ